MKSKAMVLFVLLFSAALFAQASEVTQRSGKNISGEINGTVIDSASMKAIEFATVALLGATDAEVIGGTTTDSKGNFTLSKVPGGKYRLKISVMGYTSKVIEPVMITSNSTRVSMGEVLMAENTLNMKGVEVTGQKGAIEFGVDKMVVNAEKVLPGAGGSAVDILKNTPSVSVDSDGNISLRGNTGINIQIDGKPSTLTNGKMLEQIPASAVEKVEIITNPSAKYDAEGTAGIINIVLKKQLEQNFNGMLSANVGTRDNYNSSASFNYRNNGLNIFGNYDNRFFQRTGRGFINRENYLSTGTAYFNQDFDFRFRGFSHNFKIGADYSFDKKNSVTTSLMYNLGEGHFRHLGYNNTLDSLRLLSGSYTNFNNGDRSGNTLDYSLNYKRTFETQGKELTADVFVSNSFNDDISKRTSDYFNASGAVIPGRSELQESKNENKNMFVSLKSDFVQPLSKTGKLETGYKLTFRDRNMDYDVKDFDFANQLYNANTSLSNEFEYTELIHAAYATYSDSYKKFKYQMGLRLEQTYTEGNQKTMGIKNKNDYFSWFPSIHISQELFEGYETKLSYSRRINRPNINLVNPFKRFMDPLIANAGNPYLKPEYIDSYEFGNSYFHKQSSVFATLFYRQVNDNIQFIAEVQDNNVSITTFKNLTKQTSYGIELNGSHQLLKWWNLNAGYSYYRSRIYGTYPGSGQARVSNMWNARFTSMMQLGWDMDLQFNGYYSSPQIQPQGKFYGIFWSDVSLKKSFLNKSLSVSLRMTDIFDGTKFRASIKGGNFSAVNEQKMKNQIITLSVQYNINNFKKARDRRPDEDTGGREYENMGN